MNILIKEILHPRIIEHCEKLFCDGHYKHVAFEAMMQVELALKEKSGINDKYGVNLISSLFGKQKGLKLRIPFGEDLQKHAHIWFKGAFAYLRNYAAHDGSKINRDSSLRIMVIASELLELIGASVKSFADIGGIKGLIQANLFKDKKSIIKLLKILDGYHLPDHVCDGFYEELANNGFGEDEVVALIEVGLIEYKSQKYIPSEGNIEDTFDIPDEIGWFELTQMGKKIIT